MVKLYVVSCVAPLSVPVIAPVDVFNDRPPGNEPDTTEKVTAELSSPHASMSTRTEPQPAKDPKEPAAV